MENALKVHSVTFFSVLGENIKCKIKINNFLIAVNTCVPPVLGELRLKVLIFGVEELNESCRLRDPRVAAQKFITVFLQELEATQGPGGVLPAGTALHLFVLKEKLKKKKGASESHRLGAAQRDSQLKDIPRNLGRILPDFLNLLSDGNVFFICFYNKKKREQNGY